LSLKTALICKVVVSVSVPTYNYQLATYNYISEYVCAETTLVPPPCVKGVVIIMFSYRTHNQAMALSMGEGDFRPPTAPWPFYRFSWNLKYGTTSRHDPARNNLGAMSTWVAWKMPVWLFGSFCLFWSLRHGHRSHLWTHPHTQYVIMHCSGQGSAFWGL